MAALPYMQLYVAEYLADTTHLSAIQHGGYMLLLMNYWQRGKALPNSDERLAGIARMSLRECKLNRDTLAEFFQITDAVWSHKRIEKDLKAVAEKSAKNTANGSLGGRPKKASVMVMKTERLANGLPNETQTKGNRTEQIRTEQKRAEEKRAEEKEPLAQTSHGESAPDHGKALGTIPCNGPVKQFEFFEQDVLEWQESFPGIDVMHQLRLAWQWARDNPTKRKTARGMRRFLNSWLSRAQDAVGGSNGAHQRNGFRTKEEITLAAAQNVSRFDSQADHDSGDSAAGDDAGGGILGLLQRVGRVPDPRPGSGSGQIVLDGATGRAFSYAESGRNGNGLPERSTAPPRG